MKAIKKIMMIIGFVALILFSGCSVEINQSKLSCQNLEFTNLQRNDFKCCQACQDFNYTYLHSQLIVRSKAMIDMCVCKKGQEVIELWNNKG